MKKNAYVEEYYNGTEKKVVRFVDNLNIVEKIAFVNDVVDYVISGDKFDPIIRDLMFKFTVIQYFTDIEFDIDEGKSNLEQIEEFITESNLYEVITAKIHKEVIHELDKAVNDKIFFMSGVKMNDLEYSVTKLIDEIFEKVSQFDMNSITKMIEDYTPDNLLDTYSKSESMKKILEEAMKRS